MAAKRYTLRLYHHSRMLRQEDANLDPRDDDMLRATLERMVKAERGNLKVDLSEWSLAVHSLGGGMILARLSVSSVGTSEVRR